MDYTREDFTRSGRRYDLIFGANAHHSIFRYRQMLRPRGIFVMVGGGMGWILQAVLLGRLLSLMGTRKTRFFVAKITGRDLALLKQLAEAGALVPVIDRRYRLSEVAQAMRYLEEGHAQGKIVITVVEEQGPGEPATSPPG